jgi:hypothetical protein
MHLTKRLGCRFRGHCPRGGGRRCRGRQSCRRWSDWCDRGRILTFRQIAGRFLHACHDEKTTRQADDRTT